MILNDKFIVQCFKHISSMQNFKLILLLIIINSLYGGLIIVRPGLNIGYFEALFYIYTNPYFIMILLFIILLNTLYVKEFFSKKFEYLLRLESKHKAFKKLNVMVFLYNLIIYLIQLLIVCIILNIFYSGNIGIINLKLGVNTLTYMIFFLIRTFWIIYLINYINLLILPYLSKYIILVVNSLIYICIPMGLDIFVFDSNNIQIPIYVATYFRLYPYDSFLSELASSIIFILVVNIFIYFIKKIIKVKFRSKNNEVYN